MAGPRQVGKTTLVHQLAEKIGLACVYVSADEPTLQDRNWLVRQWDTARRKAQDKEVSGCAIFIIDEIQKIPDWSETVKYFWDEDTRKNIPLKVVLLGSSPLLMQKGLTESLAGRFELIPATQQPLPIIWNCCPERE